MSVGNGPRTRAVALSVGVAIACMFLTRSAHADDTKRKCVDAATEGQTQRKADKLLEARDAFRICAAAPCPSIVKSRCTRWLDELEAQIPTVVVRGEDGAGGDVLDAKVTVDGQASEMGRPVAVDPGEHVVDVERADGARGQQKFLVVDGEKSRVLVVRVAKALPAASAGAATSPSASPSNEASGSRIPVGAWVLGGVGVGVLGAAAAFTVEAADQLNHLRNTCAPGCADADTQTGRTYALLADVSFGVGLAAVGAAVTWAVLASTGGAAKPAAAWVPRLQVRPVLGGAMAGFGARY